MAWDLYVRFWRPTCRVRCHDLTVNFRRVCHWVIGLSVTSVFALMSIAHFAAAAIIAAADPDSRAAAEAAGYTAQVRATVLDVDDRNGEKGVGYAVDVQYATSGQAVVTTLNWAVGRPPPSAGDAVDVAFDPAAPERAVPRDPADRADREWSAKGRGHLNWGVIEAVIAILVICATLRWAPRDRQTSVPAGPSTAPRQDSPQGA